MSAPLWSYLNPTAHDTITLTHTPHLPTLHITPTILHTIQQYTHNTTVYCICKYSEYIQQHTVQCTQTITVQYICTDQELAQTQCITPDLFILTLYCTNTDTDSEHSVVVQSYDTLHWSDIIYHKYIRQFIRHLHRHNTLHTTQQYTTLALQCTHNTNSTVQSITFKALCMLPAVKLQLKPIQTQSIHVSQQYNDHTIDHNTYGYITLNEYKQYVLITYNELYDVPCDQIPVVGLWTHTTNIHCKQLYMHCIEYIYNKNIQYRISIEPLKFVVIQLCSNNTVNMYECSVLCSDSVIQQYEGGCTAITNINDNITIHLQHATESLNNRLCDYLGITNINNLSLNTTTQSIEHKNDTHNNSAIKRSILKKSNSKKQQQHSVNIVTPSKMQQPHTHNILQTPNTKQLGDILQTPMRIEPPPEPTPYNSTQHSNTVTHTNSEQMQPTDVLQLYSPIPPVQRSDMNAQLNILTSQVTQLTSLMSNQLQLQSMNTIQQNTVHQHKHDASTLITPVKLQRKSIMNDMCVQVTPSLYTQLQQSDKRTSVIEQVTIELPQFDSADCDYHTEPVDTQVDTIIDTELELPKIERLVTDHELQSDSIQQSVDADIEPVEHITDEQEFDNDNELSAADSISQVGSIHSNNQHHDNKSNDSDTDDAVYTMTAQPHTATTTKSRSPAASTEVSVHSHTSLAYNAIHLRANSYKYIDQPSIRAYNISDSEDEDDSENICNNIVQKYLNKNASGLSSRYQPQKYVSDDR